MSRTVCVARSILLRTVVAALAICCTCTDSFLSLPVVAPPDPFSGQAALVLAKVGDAFISVGDTGVLPPTGGSLDASLLDVTVPDLLSAEVIHSSVIGQGQATTAETSLANLDIHIQDHRVTVEFLLARALAACDHGMPTAQGSVVFSNVVVDGVPHLIDSQPNNTMVLTDIDSNPIGRITFNEQVNSGDPPTSAITVTAIHIVINNTSDVAIGRAVAGIRCQNPTPVDDFVTGGGFIVTATGKGHFGFVAGRHGNGLSGHLVFKDRVADHRVKSTSITAYAAVNPTTRHIEGTCEVNGVAGYTFALDVADNGEPGSSDAFGITLSDGYNASGPLVGGNIQLHP